MSETKKVNEDWLAEQIAAHWGEHGAHADIYGILLKKARWAEQVAVTMAGRAPGFAPNEAVSGAGREWANVDDVHLKVRADEPQPRV